MRTVALCFTAIVLVAFVGYSGQDAVSSSLEVSAQADMVPFKASSVGAVETGGGPPGGCNDDIPRVLALSGEGTPLGKHTFTGDHCFELDGLSNFQSPGDAVRFVGGVGAWTAADGDELHCTYVGTFFPLTLNPDEGGPKGPFTVVMEVTGGTGQFEGAEGVICGVGYSSPGEQGLSASFDGTILEMSAQADMVPFKASSVGAVETGGGPPGGCNDDIPRVLALSGEGTPLGKHTFTGDHCFELDGLSNFQSPGDAVRFVGGVGAWTAADGDELHCTYVGTFFPLTLNPDEGGPKGPFTVVMEVTGGTGQFEGAEGVVYGAGYSCPGEQGLSASFDGTIFSAGVATAVGEEDIEALPGRFSLGQNSPNPFNAATEIRYQLSRSAHVKLVVYDILGARVETLVDGAHDAGDYSVLWDGLDRDGQAVASGVYFCRMEAGVEFRETRRMLLLR